MCGYLGKRVRISKEFYKPHYMMAILTIVVTFVTSYVASMLASIDPVSRERGPAYYIHVSSGILFTLAIAAMLVVNGRAYPKVHKRLVKGAHILLATMIVSSVFFA